MFLLISGGHIGAPKRYAAQYDVVIQSSTKVLEMLRQITQKLWATKTLDSISSRFVRPRSFAHTRAGSLVCPIVFSTNQLKP